MRFLLFPSLIICIIFVLTSSKSTKKLEYNPEGKFKIVHFTDLHFGHSEDYNLGILSN